MDLLTSSYHYDSGSPSNLRSDNNQPLYTNVEKFMFPDDMIDLQCTLAGRESFSIEGRDSLGILQNFNHELDVPKLTFDPVQEENVGLVQLDFDGRESIGIPRSSFINDGRDSLGLLRISFLEDGRHSLLRNSLDIPASLSSNLLNIGFTKLSTTSSISSTDSAFRPSLWSLDYDSEELSKIFSFTFNSKNTSNLNTAFVDSNKKDEDVENNGAITEKSDTNKEIEVKEVEQEMAGSLEFENNVEVNDAVFLENKIIAEIENGTTFNDLPDDLFSDIKNGTIFNDLPDDLFSTDLPELFYISFDESTDLPTGTNIDANIKTLDQLCSKEKSEIDFENEEIDAAPSIIKSLEENVHEMKEENKDFIVSSCEISTEKDLKINFPKLKQPADILNISFSLKLSNNCSRNSSNSRSRDAKDLINNLSTIINTENLDNQSEVKQILQDLADVLLVPNDKEKNDDSGHSSIEENDVDSSLKYCSEENIAVKLEGNDDNHSGKRLSQSFSYTSTTTHKSAMKSEKTTEQSVDNVQQKTRQRSLDQFDGFTKANVKKMSLPSLKLRPRKNDIEAVKKGPLKAVIPLSNMKRRSYAQPKKIETPIKNSSLEKSYLKKRTSTPKTWNAVPVAQSTPEQVNESESLSKSVQYSGRKINLPLSPQLSTSSLSNSTKKHDLLNRSSSASAPNISRSMSPSRIPSIVNLVAAPSKSHLISRRRSVSEIKYATNTNKNLGSNTSNRFAKSPLARYNTPGGKVVGTSTFMRIDYENGYPQKPGSCSPVSSVGNIIKGLNKTVSKIEGIKSYSSERNRNLIQFAKPLNLLNKMKK